MLTRLKFSNFKTWETVEVDLAPITLLFGPNSSGKSSLLQFLLLLKQTKETADRALALDLGGPYVSLGTYRDLVFRHEESRDIAWSLQWKPDKKILIQDLSVEPPIDLVQAARATVEGRVSGREGGPKATELVYDLDGRRFFLKPANGNGGFQLGYEGQPGFSFTRDRGRPPALPGPVKSYGFQIRRAPTSRTPGF